MKEMERVNFAPQYAPLISKGAQFVPAGDTRFRKGEPMFAYFEIYEPLLLEQPSSPVQVRLRIANAKTEEIKTDTGPRDVSSFVQPNTPTIRVSEKIAVDQLPPGSYRLDVLASDSAGRSTTWRTAMFKVE
jgi:hypothetical protein